MYLFRNDYSFGAHPKVLEALTATNLEGCPGYGSDPHCAAAAERLKALCEAPDADVQFFIGGTSARFRRPSPPSCAPGRVCSVPTPVM